MPRPPGHGPGYEVKRQEIIDAAADLFGKKGYAATGIAEIGKAAGLAKGALYYYIGSKENLLVEIQARVLTPLLTSAKEIAALDEDPVVRLRLLSETLLDMIFRRLDHIWVYEHDYRQLRGANKSRLKRQRGQFEQIVQDLLVEAMDSGAFRTMNPRIAVLQFLNMHNHTYQWVRPNGPWDAAYLSREYCATLFSGFRSESYDLSDLEDRVAKFRDRNAPAET
ncbi:MAG: TetR family transcriptional regulator [Streptosporangiales bacterium]|nr:TetR family transcriptional regulator [Streptosporangiales bacterium]